MAETIIPIVDLFAGPGGLGEGFSALEKDGLRPFSIIVSAEKDPSARATLRLRAFYRLLQREAPDYLSEYRNFCTGVRSTPWSQETAQLWQRAGDEAMQLTLGDDEDNAKLDAKLDNAGLNSRPWVLIGGPPCQAYSLIGRARNKGKLGYVPENDSRHFLYQQYLRIIARHQPAVFVMENVKGLLSSKVGERHMFSSILRDLSSPAQVAGQPLHGPAHKYRIHSVATGACFEPDQDPSAADHQSWVVRSEQFGIPQSRHRVVLIGVREGLRVRPEELVIDREPAVSVRSAIGDMPRIRSRCTDHADSTPSWDQLLDNHLSKLLSGVRGDIRLSQLEEVVIEVTRSKSNWLPLGVHPSPTRSEGGSMPESLRQWIRNDPPDVVLNHESRGHMGSDLYRYLFAAVYTEAVGTTPKGAGQFSLPDLAPDHKNWDTGKFKDRFFVQAWSRPASTVTSHIGKDGHHYIHPDPMQNRSLSVREAARLQTFPDNYLFCGNRTEQYTQVGNAVPPYLARKIADKVLHILKENRLA